MEGGKKTDDILEWVLPTSQAYVGAVTIILDILKGVWGGVAIIVKILNGWGEGAKLLKSEGGYPNMTVDDN